MEIKEVILETLVPIFNRYEIREEQWYAVKFGDREFLIPKQKQVLNIFTKKIYHESEFSLYFDGDKVLTNNNRHKPMNTKKVDKHKFIVLQDNVELLKPENFTLLAKENGLALYMINNDKILTIYRNGNIYRVIGPAIRKTITFEKERPLNDETYNLVQRLASYHKAKFIKVDVGITSLKIRILDYNDVKVYTAEDTNKYRIFVIENAEFVKIYDDTYVAIKGDKTYIVMDIFYTPISSDVKQIETETIEYNNKYEVYEYIIPDTVKVIHEEKQEYSVNETTSIERTIIAEIPSINSEIIVRKVIRKAEDVLKITSNKRKDKLNKYEETSIAVKEPIKLKHKTLEPEVLEENTYKVRDFINKPVEVDYC